MEKCPKVRSNEEQCQGSRTKLQLDLETQIKEAAANPNLTELNCCLEHNNNSQIPNDYKTLARKLIHQWGVIVVDDRMIGPKRLRYAALNALHFGHPRINKTCNDGALIWLLSKRADNEKKKQKKLRMSQRRKEGKLSITTNLKKIKSICRKYLHRNST